MNFNIANWTLQSIKELDKTENEYMEFKSGALKADDIKNKLSVAASAFSNANGGLFIIGIDKFGNIDGCNLNVGKQSPRDWIDQIIRVEPMCRYEVKIIEQGISLDNKCIIIVKFFQSPSAPHMAYDNKYYIRNGAHSIPASHYIIEGIKLRAKFRRPTILWRLVEDMYRPGIIKLILFTIENQSAYNVKIDFDKYIKTYENDIYAFPLEISLINQEYPFSMDMYIWGAGHQLWGAKSITLKLEYEDLIGSKYKQEYVLDKNKAIAPRMINTETALDKIQQEIKEISESIKTIAGKATYKKKRRL